MRLFPLGTLLVVSLLLSGCRANDSKTAEPARPVVRSVSTDLNAGACRKDFDKSDPDETPYLRCPGVAGYELIIRRVGSGRQSIDVVPPAHEPLPLDFQEVVTRSMSTVGPRAEWRVSASNGRQQVPIALIVPVLAHEDNEHPEKVTRTYLAVAKIEPTEACVVNRIPADSQSETELYRSADSAREHPCAPALPPMTVGGVVIR